MLNLKKTPIWIAFMTAIAAFFFQALGYSETCTGGKVDTFVATALYSTPFFLASFIILTANILHTNNSIHITTEIAWTIAIGATGILILHMNSFLVWGVLAIGETPCFIRNDFGDYRLPPLFSGEYVFGHVAVGIVYGVMPVFLTLFSAVLLLKNSRR